MATYSLEVVLDRETLLALKEGGFSLCVAKNVNGQFNVVWKSLQLLVLNRIQWTEQYQVFGEEGFASGCPVNPVTNASDIQYGQTCTLSSEGIMGPAEGSEGGVAFKVKNEYSTTNLAVNGLFYDGWHPIYVNPNPALVGTQESLSPLPSILVWFDTTLKTSMMFSQPVSGSLKIDYTIATSHTVSYVSGGSGPGNGMWVMDDPTTGLRFTPGKLYYPLSGKFEDLPFAKDKCFIQTLINKYFTTPMGKKQLAATTDYIVQASITFAEDVVLAQVAEFINDNLPRSAQVLIKCEASKLVVRIGWAPTAVASKRMIHGESSAEQLKELFSNLINLYSPGYRSVDYSILDIGAHSAPSSGPDVISYG